MAREAIDRVTGNIGSFEPSFEQRRRLLSDQFVIERPRIEDDTRLAIIRIEYDTRFAVTLDFVFRRSNDSFFIITDPRRELQDTRNQSVYRNPFFSKADRIRLTTSIAV